MKRLILLLSIISIDCYGQNCSSCTQTISNMYSGNLTVSVGDIICISNTGVISGTITQNGGVVCNEGTISGNVSVNDGIFNNYGSITGAGQSIIHNKGDFNNEGTINNGSFITQGNTATINNYANIVTGSIDLDSTGLGPRPVFNNNGVIQATTLTLANSNFINDNSFTLSGNMLVGEKSYVFNDGFLQIGGNCTVNSGDGQIRTNCIAQVNGNFVNAGIINGSLSSCGGFYVSGFASSSTTGRIGMDNSYIDICEQGNPNGLLNSGLLGPNTTQCSCTNSCSASTGIYELSDNSIQFIYPNPVDEVLMINSAITLNGAEYFVFSSLGEIMQSGILNGNAITVSSLTPGVYFIAFRNNDEFIYRKIIKN